MGDDSAELPDKLQKKIIALGEEAEAAANAADWKRARELYLEAFHLLPEPRYEWAVGELLLSGAAAAMIGSGAPDDVIELLKDGLEAPVMNQPLINLRLGQAFLGKGDKEQAAGHLLFALLGGGAALFREENVLDCYAFATEVLRPPDECATWDEYAPPESWPPDDVSEWFELKLRQ